MPNHGRISNHLRRRILIFEAIRTGLGLVALLLLRHAGLLNLSAASGYAAFLVLILIWIWVPSRWLSIYKTASPAPGAASPAPAAPSGQAPTEIELEFLHAVVDSLPDRIYVKDRQSKFLLANRALREFSTGSPHGEMVGKDDFSFFPPAIAAQFMKDEQAIMSSGTEASQSSWDADSAGRETWTVTTKVPYREPSGTIVGLIGIGRNLTDQKRLEESLVRAHEEMSYKATHDELTALLNRALILELLDRELTRSRRENGCTTVLLADVDNFKQVNDTYGHLVGDQVLREVARRLLESVRSYDFVGRYGGEEFLLVLSNSDSCTTLDRADQIRAAISSAPIATPRGDLVITLSVGVLASRDWSVLSVEETLREADTALYAAKAAGRNCCQLARSPAAE